MPVCVFVATVLNESADDFDVSIAFTFRNGTGNRKWNREGECTAIKFTHNDESEFLNIFTCVCFPHTDQFFFSKSESNILW